MDSELQIDWSFSSWNPVKNVVNSFYLLEFDMFLTEVEKTE